MRQTRVTNKAKINFKPRAKSLFCHTVREDVREELVNSNDETFFSE